MKRRLLFYSVLIVGLLTSCADEEENPLPYVHVDFSIPLSPQYPKLIAGLSEKVQRGYYGYQKNGVIIVPQSFSNNNYEAFDATCTRNIIEEDTAINSINVDENGFTATCPTCRTVYNLLSGYAQNQSFRLQRYKAHMSNGRVYVRN